MTRLGSPLRDSRSALILVGFVAALVYLNSLANLFAYDDVHIIENNEAIHSLETLPGALVKPYWPTPQGQGLGLWRPVTTGLFGLQYVIGGGSALIFHVVNVLLHVVASVLVVVLCIELLSLPAALIAGLVFAIHPVHVEAVANIVGLSELLSAVALLAACILHIRGGPVSSWGRSLAIGAVYLVGFGAKESGVTLPGLIFLLDAVRERIGFRELPAYLGRRWRLYLVMLVVAIGLLMARFSVLGSLAHAYEPLGASMLNEIPRIWTLGEIWLHYVRLWVFPLDLSSDYAPNVLSVWTSWGLENSVGAGLALLILVVTLLCWRRPEMGKGVDTAKAAAFGVLWFIVSISPTSNTLFLSGILLAERTLYLPSVGLAAATGWFFVRMARERRRAAVVLLVLALGAGAVRTWTRNPAWYDTSRVFTVLVRDYPQSGRSQWLLGDQFMMAGRHADGMRAYRAAISLLNTSYPLITEIARSLTTYGYYRGAESLLRFAIAEHPEFAQGYRLMSASRAEQGDAVDTEHWARLALLHQGPGEDAARHHLLAWALASQGRMEEAAVERALGEETGRPVFWQGFVYDAYVLQAQGDSAGVVAALDSAWAAATTTVGREALDSVRVAEFAQEPRISGSPGDDDGPVRGDPER